MDLELKNNNYKIIRQFLNADEAKAISETVQKSTNKTWHFDWMVGNALAAYNYLPITKILIREIPQVSKKCGLEVLPTYCYVRKYQKGSALFHHTDRHACQISLTLNLNKTVDWAICIKKPDGTVASVELQPGDAMLYLGVDAEHWRDPLEEDGIYDQAFLHYVDANGPYAYTVFDKANELSLKGLS
jgi:hypothetical protein